MEDTEFSGFVFDKHQTEFKTLDWKIAKGILKMVPVEFKRKLYVFFGDTQYKKMSNAHQEENNLPDLLALRL